MYLWETVKLSPSVIGYFALSVVVGVGAGACPAPYLCSSAVQSYVCAHNCPSSAVEVALVVPTGEAGSGARRTPQQ